MRQRVRNCGLRQRVLDGTRLEHVGGVPRLGARRVGCPAAAAPLAGGRFGGQIEQRSDRLREGRLGRVVGYIDGRRRGGVQVDLTVHQVDSLVRVLTHEAIPHFGDGAVLWQLVRALMEWLEHTRGN